jgi:hypothetical protein
MFAVATQIHLMTGPGTSILKGLGRPQEEIWYAIPNLLAVLLLLPLSRLLLGSWTVVGIAAAVGLSTVISAVYFIGWANHLLGVSPLTYLRAVVLPGLVPYPVAFLIATPALLIAGESTRLVGAVVLALIGIVYTGMLAALVDRVLFEDGERRWFHAVARHHAGRVLPLAGTVRS